MIWLHMFLEFFKTGLFASGGGLATLPFLFAISSSTGWFTTTDIANMVAISEATPGPLGINMATYAGYCTLGPLGGLWASLSITSPALIVITVIAKMLSRFKDSKIIPAIFYGLRPCSTALITAAGLSIAQLTFLPSTMTANPLPLWSSINYKAILLALFLWILYRKYKKHPIFYIALSAVAGIIFEL